MEPIPHESFGSVLRGHEKEKVEWENEGNIVAYLSKVIFEKEIELCTGC